MLDSISNAPVGFLILDGSLNVMEANRAAATEYGIASGTRFDTHIHADDIIRVRDFLLSQDAGQSNCILHHDGGQKAVLITKSVADDHVALWLEDQSLLQALQRQIQQADQPLRKMLRDLRHLHATALGYGELVQIMLDENRVLEGNAHATVTRYHEQLVAQLQNAEGLMGKQSQQHQRRHILVVDDEPIITEYLIELMRSREYKVTGFTEPTHALKSFEMNPQAYDLAVIDHHMPGLDGLALASGLRNCSADLPVVLCTTTEGLSQADAVQEILTKPVDINLLTRTISDLLS